MTDYRVRNKKVAMSRWEKVHKKDREYIKKNKNKYSHLKARIMGFIAGDGNILSSKMDKCSHNTIRFYPDHHSLVDSFEEAILAVYNKKSKVKSLKNYYSVTIDSKQAVEDLLKSGNFRTTDWEVPSQFLKTSLEKREWLRAFFDTEGHVHNKYIRIQTVNKKGMKQLDKLLGEFRINTKKYTYMPKNPRHKEVFILIILKREDQRKYLDKIGFNHTIKLKKLNNKFQEELSAAIA